MDRRIILGIGVATMLAACSSSQNSGAPQSQQGIVALQQSTSADGGTRVSVRSLPTAGTIVTMVGQLRYDASQLQMKSCELNPQIGDGTPAGKALQFAEPSPGLISAVVVGGLEPLPQSTELFSCTFAAASGASSGPVTVHADGNVSDTTFEDREFVAEATIATNAGR